MGLALLTPPATMKIHNMDWSFAMLTQALPKGAHITSRTDLILMMRSDSLVPCRRTKQLLSTHLLQYSIKINGHASTLIAAGSELGVVPEASPGLT